MGRGRARRHAVPEGSRDTNPALPPTTERDDGSAVWDVDPFVVSAHPAAGIDDAVVVLDGRATSPDAALALADALRAAACGRSSGSTRDLTMSLDELARTRAARAGS